MSPILIYFIETLLCSGLFLLLYHWFIARRAGYGFCRKYLIVTMVLASVIPMLNVPLYPPLNTDSKVAVVSEPEKVETVGTVAETSSVVSPEPVSAPAPEVSASAEIATVEQAQTTPVAERSVQQVSDFLRRNALLIIYLTGVAVSLVAIVGGAVSVARIRRKSHITQARSYDLAESDGVETPFSFLHTIYMGYGYDEHSGKVTGRSHDGGIDGIISEDKLGLGLIYIQAKRYSKANKVGRKEIQAFVGAMEHIQKGVFTEKQQQKSIKLIDGDALTDLIIRNEIGIQPVYKYTVYKVDSDYYRED